MQCWEFSMSKRGAFDWLLEMNDTQSVSFGTKEITYKQIRDAKNKKVSDTKNTMKMNENAYNVKFSKDLHNNKK